MSSFNFCIASVLILEICFDSFDFLITFNDKGLL